MKLKTKDLLTLAELTPKEFVELIDDSIKLKKEFKKSGNKPILKNKDLRLLDISIFLQHMIFTANFVVLPILIHQQLLFLVKQHVHFV